ncbi:hypothetical protein MBANPS3_003442 [Mucor bainieri]
MPPTQSGRWTLEQQELVSTEQHKQETQRKEEEKEKLKRKADNIATLQIENFERIKRTHKQFWENALLNNNAAWTTVTEEWRLAAQVELDECDEKLEKLRKERGFACQNVYFRNQLHLEPIFSNFHKTSSLHDTHNTYNSDTYPFFIPKATLLDIGKNVDETRKAVDICDYFLHVVPTMFVPELVDAGARTALIALTRGRAIALSWEITANDLVEMDQCLNKFFVYCNQQTAAENLSRAVYTPMLHYLTHLSATIRSLGPMPSYSCRSLERSIGYFKTLMTAKINDQAQPSNLVEKVMVRSLLGHTLDVEKMANLIPPASTKRTNWIEHADDNNGVMLERQLWSVCNDEVMLPDDKAIYQGVLVKTIRKALSHFYKRRTSDKSLQVTGTIKFRQAARAWLEDKVILSSNYHADATKEFRRAGYFVIFETAYWNKNNATRYGWHVGKVLWFLQHQLVGGDVVFLAFVELLRGCKTADDSKYTPQVRFATRSERPRYAMISVDDEIWTQVGLVKHLRSNNWFTAIGPRGVFEDLSTSCGNITKLQS